MGDIQAGAKRGTYSDSMHRLTFVVIPVVVSPEICQRAHALPGGRPEFWSTSREIAGGEPWRIQQTRCVLTLYTHDAQTYLYHRHSAFSTSTARTFMRPSRPGHDYAIVRPCSSCQQPAWVTEYGTTAMGMLGIEENGAYSPRADTISGLTACPCLLRMFVRPSPGIEFACKYRIQSQLFCSQAGRDEEKRARAQHGGGGWRRGGSASAVRLGKQRIGAPLLPTDSARCVPLSLCLVEVLLLLCLL